MLRYVLRGYVFLGSGALPIGCELSEAEGAARLVLRVVCTLPEACFGLRFALLPPEMSASEAWLKFCCNKSPLSCSPVPASPSSFKDASSANFGFSLEGFAEAADF